MNLLIRSATIIEPNSSFHNSPVDIFIKNGVISQIDTGINVSGAEVFNAAGCYVSPGFFDLNCNAGELGQETREDLQTVARAAAAGGFTGLALMPNAGPVHSKTEVAYLINKARHGLVDIFPLGTISHKREGKDLAEMYDMYLTGARAFTDGNRPVQDAGLMERALLYAQGFGGLVFSYPEDLAIAKQGKVHEGPVSTRLGLKGIPSLAEELMIARDLYLAEYTGSPIHFSTISTAGGVGLVREARRRGLKVTCDVAAHHLVLTDETLSGFDSRYKVKPPLRLQSDVDALLAGLRDDTIDAIVSQHTPLEVELKNVEFEVAEYGMLGLQTAFSLAVQAGLSVETIVAKMSVNPRRLLNMEVPSIAVGCQANLVVLDPKQEWLFDREHNYSRSYNSPFLGQTLPGKVLLTCNNGQIYNSK